jgi:hypothetical protein
MRDEERAPERSPKPFSDWQLKIDFLVGVAGFEPAASSSRTKRAAKLRYTPATAMEV